jgi:NUMOD4 motif/HNH endonuclease
MLNLPDEIWKPVIGFEGFYEISNRGRVKSLARKVWIKSRWGQHQQISVRERVLAATPDKEGYLCVMFAKDGKRWCKKIHRLVLETFIGQSPPGMQCRHLDGNRLNNAPNNLCWGTSKEDAADRIKHGVHPRGDRLRTAKLSNSKVRIILRSKLPSRQLAAKFGVFYTVIDKVKRREIWKHVQC